MDDIYHTIFTHLPIKDIIICSMVNKQFYSIIKLEFLWETVHKNNSYTSIIFRENYYEICKLHFMLDKLKQKLGHKKCSSKLYKASILKITNNKCQLTGKRKGTYISYDFNLIDRLRYFPKELGELNNLGSLWLTENKLTSIPSELGKLTNLYELNLSNNYLTSLPSEIGNLHNLYRLYLTHNHISIIPNELGNLTKLEILELSYNKLISVPLEFRKLIELKHLHISNNELITLPSELSQLTELRSLNLYNNNMISLPEELNKFKGMISGSNRFIVYPF
jgi:Leucine-rich repeat (LRR) protein